MYIKREPLRVREREQIEKREGDRGKKRGESAKAMMLLLTTMYDRYERRHPLIDTGLTIPYAQHVKEIFSLDLFLRHHSTFSVF